MTSNQSSKELLIERSEELFCELERAGVSLCSGNRPSEQTLEKLLAHLEIVQRWNKRVDLVSPAPLSVLIERHIIDCLAVSLIIRSKLDIPIDSAYLDLGSGAGYPGLVLAICEENRRVMLCEAREKRALFLKEARRELGLKNVKVMCSRMEELELKEDKAGLVITRALETKEPFLESLPALLASQGRAVLMAGPSWKDDSSIVPGIGFDEVFEYQLGPKGPSRKFVVWKCFT